MDRRQMTFFRDGCPRSATRRTNLAARTSCSARTAAGVPRRCSCPFDPATLPSTLLTDGKSRNGMAGLVAHAGLIAYDSTRRGGHGGRDRDLYVMNPSRSVERAHGDGARRLVGALTGPRTIGRS